MKKILLEAPDSQLDSSVKVYIAQWSEPPTPIQVLHVLDKCINYSLGSSFVVSALQFFYKLTCEDFKTTHEEVEKDAFWRKYQIKENSH